MTGSDTQISLSAEKQFVFQDAFNRGYNQLPRMVVACIGLSIQAKGVYSFIANYVYEHGKSAFPSIHRIAIACELTAKSVVKHISELVDKGLIKKERRGRGETNNYYIKDAHEVDLLHVSEMLWKAMYGALREVKGSSWENVHDALILLNKELRERGLSLYDLVHSEENTKELETGITEVMKGGIPSLNFKLPIKPNLTKTVVAGDASTDRKTGSTFLDQHESQWRTDDFRKYFYRKHYGVTGTAHAEVDTVHRSIIARALKQLDGDKTQLRKYIDAFFEIGYDNISLEQFGTSGRFPELSLYMQDGKKPFYIDKKQKAESKRIEAAEAEQQHKGISKDELIKRLRGEK